MNGTIVQDESILVSPSRVSTVQIESQLLQEVKEDILIGRTPHQTVAVVTVGFYSTNQGHVLEGSFVRA